MQAEEFPTLMAKIDKALAGRRVPAWARAPRAYHQIEGPGVIDLQVPFDRTRPHYEGTNLFHQILRWYDKHYPKNSVCVPPLGRRTILVRSEAFLLSLPPAFNIKAQTIPAIRHVEGMSKEFLAILDPMEMQCIQLKFNTCFQQASRLALLCVKLRRFWHKTNAVLLHDLILSARADLNSATDAVLRPDMGSYAWCSQQAVEKFFKAFLVFSDSSMDAARLKRFGHNLQILLAESRKHNKAFDQVVPFLHKAECSPQDRYQPARLSLGGAIDKVDMAYAISDLIVQIMLDTIRKNEMARK